MLSDKGARVKQNYLPWHGGEVAEFYADERKDAQKKH
jgi:hypothetical protein